MKNNEILALFDQWNNALKTGNPKEVVKLYAAVSNKVRHNHEEIEDYFVHFLSKVPSGKITESNIRIFDDVAINSGIYLFSFADGSSVEARFTYVYTWDGENWLITEHHSSIMPES